MFFNFAKTPKLSFSFWATTHIAEKSEGTGVSPGKKNACAGQTFF